MTTGAKEVYNPYVTLNRPSKTPALLPPSWGVRTWYRVTGIDGLLMVMSVSLYLWLIWKGNECNLEQIYPLHFLWITFLQEHWGKQKLSKLWAEWHFSWFWTIGFASIWWVFGCQKKSLPKKVKLRVWLSKICWFCCCLLFFFFFLRDVTVFEHLSLP